jgi:hypothetical protein
VFLILEGIGSFYTSSKIVVLIRRFPYTVYFQETLEKPLEAPVQI